MGNSNKSLVNLIVGIVLIVIGIAWYVIERYTKDFENDVLAGVCMASDKVVLDAKKTHRQIEHARYGDGNDIWLDTTKSPWIINGDIIGTVGFGRIITDMVPEDIREKYKEPDFFDEMPKPLEGDYTRKDPVLRGFDSDKIKKTVKKYPPQYEVLYSLMFEFTIVHTGGRRELKREWTAYRRNPDNCITQMRIILESISNSVDVYLTNTEWNYETQLLISGY